MSEEKRICAFIDILGFKNEILNSDDERRSKIIQLISEITNEDSQQSMNTVNLGFGQVSHPSAEVTSFSDNIVISCSLEPVIRKFRLGNEVKEIQDTPRHFIDHLFIKIISVYWKALQLGLLFRGGITVGKLYHKNRVVVGEALINSYQLETETSYPRIEISEEVIKIIESHKKYPDEDLESLYLYKDEKYIVNTFCFHYGLWRDYAYINNIENLELKTILDVVDNILIMAQNNYDKYRLKDNQKIADKWKWFIDTMTNEYNRSHWLQIKENVGRK